MGRRGEATVRVVCHKCGRGPNEIGGYLQRVNAVGRPGVWECRPSCKAEMTNEERVLAAIEGGGKKRSRE